MTKCIGLMLLFLSLPVYGQVNDYGKFPSAAFSKHYEFSDTVGLSGSNNVDLYTNGQSSPEEIAYIYSQTYYAAKTFLKAKRNYVLDGSATIKHIDIKVLTIAQLNDPDNFADTEKECMYKPDRPAGGCYVGRTFYGKYSGYITVYVAHSKLTGIYSDFRYVLSHELLHSILYRYGWHYNMTEPVEHKLVYSFLYWLEENVAARTAKHK